MKFEQYSRLPIRLNIFRFSAINLKTNSKFGKKKLYICIYIMHVGYHRKKNVTPKGVIIRKTAPLCYEI